MPPENGTGVLSLHGLKWLKFAIVAIQVLPLRGSMASLIVIYVK